MVKVRRVSTLVRALMMGVVATSGALATGSVVVGCSDENAASTHVKRLSDPVKRTASVERLIQMYNDKMTLDGKNREGANVKPLLDEIVPPLAQLAESSELDQKSQGQLLAMLADTRDKRAMGALVKAMESYRFDDKRPEEYDANMNEVVRNLGEMKATEASGALLKLFQGMRASLPKAQNKQFYRTVQDAMLAISDAKWEDALVKLLDSPINSLNTKEPKVLREVQDQVLWQSVASTILGNLKSEKAVPSLMRVYLSPMKGPMASSALVALIRIGKPSIDASVKLLNGQDAEMMKYAEEEALRFAQDQLAIQGNTDGKVDEKTTASAKKAYIEKALGIVAAIGHGECTKPLLEQIEKGDETTDVTIASQLGQLPKDDGATAAFKKVFVETKPDLMVMNANAKALLTNAAASFIDADLAAFVAAGVLDVRAEDSALEQIQQVGLQVLAKLARPADLELLGKLKTKVADKIKAKQGTDKAEKAKLDAKLPTLKGDEKAQAEGDAKEFDENIKEADEKLKALDDAVKTVTDLLNECGDKADCYWKKLEDPASKKGDGLAYIKSAYMVAAIEGEKALGKFVDMRSQSSNEEVAPILEGIIGRLAPKGDAAAVEKLQAYADKAMASRDEQRANSVANLKILVSRLRARAQQ